MTAKENDVDRFSLPRLAIDELEIAVAADEAKAKRISSFMILKYDDADFLRAAAAANIGRAVYVGR